MAKRTTQNPPTPVIEKPTNPNFISDECEKLKEKYDMEVATYNEHRKIKSRRRNSHHILQDATVKDYIAKGAGICVILANSRRGTAHQVTTKRQNKRRDNKRNGTRGAKPPTTIGGLKKASQADLEESFKKKKIPPGDAEKLAECLVAEANKAVKKAAKKQRKNVTDRSKVRQTGGCFPTETLVWLDARRRRRVGRLNSADTIEGLGRIQRVLRRDRCVNELVRLHLAGSMLRLAPFHCVWLEPGRSCRADQLRAGMEVMTHHGAVALDQVAHERVPRCIHSIGVGANFECRIGRAGLWVELPDTGVAVSHRVRLRPLPIRAAAGLQGAAR